jgi:hypothetical protein
MGFAVDRQASNAELQSRRYLGERRAGALATGQAVGDDTDMVTRIGLAIGEIENVTKDSADGRAHRVDDAKRPVWCLGHG